MKKNKKSYASSLQSLWKDVSTRSESSQTAVLLKVGVPKNATINLAKEKALYRQGVPGQSSRCTKNMVKEKQELLEKIS